MSRNSVVCLAAFCFAAPLLAQPTAPNDRTGGLLAYDNTLDAVYLVRDADGDGVAEAATVFFGAGNAAGIAATNVFALFQAADRTVYIGDGDTDTVYALRDNNADGDAMDAGEATAWLTSGLGNHLNWTVATPNGLASFGGEIYILNAGVGSAPDDAIYRTRDLTGDGDANDEGECDRWFDISTHLITSAPFELAMIGGTAFFADTAGDPDSIQRAFDIDSSGTIETGEFGVFHLDGTHGAPTDFSCATDTSSIYVHNLTGTQVLARLTDSDASGSINDAGEVSLVWSESALPVGVVLQSSFAVAHGPLAPVPTLAISSHGTGTQDAIILIRDLGPDGDFFDAGETTAFYTGTADSGVFPEDIRTMTFYAPVCRGDFDRNGVKAVPDIFAFLSAWFAQLPEADVDGVPGIEVPDIFSFLSLWFGPC